MTGAGEQSQLAAFEAPVVATYGATDPSAPLVVLLHGRGSNEREIGTGGPMQDRKGL
jgi:hypothetical protein